MDMMWEEHVQAWGPRKTKIQVRIWTRMRAAVLTRAPRPRHAEAP